MATELPPGDTGYDSASGDYQQLQSGELPAGSVDPTPGATNFLGLTVYQGTAILSGNTYDVGAVIPLDGTPIAGDVQSEIGFLDSGNVGVADPLAMSTSDFAVWDLSSGMVPVAEDAIAVATEPPVDTTVPTTAPITTSAPIVPRFRELIALPRRSIRRARLRCSTRRSEVSTPIRYRKTQRGICGSRPASMSATSTPS
ncbi:MAG: hypothetical protein R2848_11890 [Thermomicrobiales bacterium]